MEKQINSIIKYVANSDDCRSVQLLKYFGETSKSDCGCCDICLSKSGKPKDNTIKNAINVLIEYFEDGQPHNIQELNSIALPRKQMELALDKLLYDEILVVEGNKIRKL